MPFDARGLVAVIVLLVASVPARSANVTYDFTGTVTSESTGPTGGLPLPTIGQKVAISVVVNLSYPFSFSPQSGVVEYQEEEGSGLIVSATINGQDVANAAFDIIIQKNVGGVSRISIGSGSPPHGLPLGGFELDFTTTNPGVVTSFAIPSAIVPQDFQTATFTASPGLFEEPLTGPPGFVPIDPSFSGTIDPTLSVPEPGAFPLLAAGLLGLLSLRGRSGRASRSDAAACWPEQA